MRLAVPGAHPSGVVVGHIRGCGAHLLGGPARLAVAHCIASDHAEGVVSPGGEGYTVVVPVPRGLRARRGPRVRAERRVVLDDEVGDGRVVLADELPVELGHPRVTGRHELHVYGRVWYIWDTHTHTPSTTQQPRQYSSYSVT